MRELGQSSRAQAPVPGVLGETMLAAMIASPTLNFIVLSMLFALLTPYS